MLANSIHLYHSPGSKVLVEGLQKQKQYNGIEGVVVKMDALRMRVLLDTLDHTELMPKPENVCPLLPTAPKLQEQLLKLHDFAQEETPPKWQENDLVSGGPGQAGSWRELGGLAPHQCR